MFNTKYKVDNIRDVPSPWMFEHYCALDQKLTGQNIKIRSVFNDGDRIPSMSIFFNQRQQKYRFNDFSTGRSGDGIDLVQQLKQLDFHKAAVDILNTYREYLAGNINNEGIYVQPDFRQHTAFKVTAFQIRLWTLQDQEFWTPFHIGSGMLESHMVRPLEYYTMTKTVDNKPVEFTNRSNHLYGYFQKDGTLTKIYQPRNPDRKFISVTSYIQGTEQLTGHRHLLIPSSLKDIMALKSLKIRIDMLAPDSENTMFPDWMMQTWLTDYEMVLLLFDNDTAGIKAMKKYKEIYPAIECCFLTMSKDPSDSIRDHGPREVRNRLVPILDRKLSKLTEVTL